MSFSSRRRNYLLTPHRRDGLIEWMKSMLTHSFVLDALHETGADTFSHFEVLIDEHRKMEEAGSARPSRLKQLVPTVGTFHTHLPLRNAFEVYNAKHKLTKRKHIQISFNEIRHILNLAQVMAMRTPTDEEMKSAGNTTSFLMDTLANSSTTDVLRDDDVEDDVTNPPGKLNGPKMITFDADQTIYSDGANFDAKSKLAHYLTMLLKHDVTVAIVTAAGYEYNVEKYEHRLAGLLQHFKSQGLGTEECQRFFLFGGECNYLLTLGPDYRLVPVQETGPGGWFTSTRYLSESPVNWPEESIKALLDTVEETMNQSMEDQNLRGRVIRKKRSVGLVPQPDRLIPREALDETVLRCQKTLHNLNDGNSPDLPFCCFNGGTDAWVDVGNKKVGVQILQSYVGVPATSTLHIGDQFLNTGNDYAARDVCPCIWITSPKETTYILKTIFRLSGISIAPHPASVDGRSSVVDFEELERRSETCKEMDVYTGEITTSK